MINRLESERPIMDLNGRLIAYRHKKIPSKYIIWVSGDTDQGILPNHLYDEAGKRISTGDLLEDIGGNDIRYELYRNHLGRSLISLKDKVILKVNTGFLEGKIFTSEKNKDI